MWLLKLRSIFILPPDTLGRPVVMSSLVRMFAYSIVSLSLCLIQGFGELSGEHWLGNDIIHKLTSSQEYSLHVQLKDREGNEAFSQYEHFYIDGEENNYR